MDRVSWAGRSCSLNTTVMDPGNLPLPTVLDSLLSCLADALPPPLYSFVIQFLSHCLALLSAFLNFVIALLSKSPAEWNVQTLLPPLISLIATYLALVSIYRTTSWLIRTSLWFAKWGILFGALATTIGWCLGSTQTSGIVTSGIALHSLDYLSDIIKGLDTVGKRQEVHMGDSRKSTGRPEAWESFGRHKEWQDSTNFNEDVTQNSNLERLFSNLMDVASRTLKESQLGLKNVMGGRDSHYADETDRTRSRKNSESRSRWPFKMTGM